MTILQDVLNVIPWLVLLVVFLGMLWHCHEVVAALASALARGQAAAVPITAVPAKPVAPALIPQLQTVPTTPAKPTGPFDSYPSWFQGALHEIGFHETGSNQGLDRYIQLAHCGANGDPWCAIFANAMLEQAGVAGTRSPAAQSFRTSPLFVQLAGPAPGALAVYWRGSQDSGSGHVGFYRGEDATRVWTLGGNEDDMVQIEALPKSSETFGLIGYWWPKSVPLPTVAPVKMSANSAVSVQVQSSDFGAVEKVPPAPAAQFKALVAGGYFSSAPFDKSIPASIRTNNPGALNVASWIKSAPGYVGDKVTSMSGAESNSTVIFSAPEYGVAAWFTLLQKYRAAGAVTLSAIINRYGGGQDYSSYVAEVAAWSGIGEQDEISPDNDVTLLAFAKAMFRYEAGRPTPLSDAQIIYGFNLARGSVASQPTTQAPATPNVA